MNPHQYAVLTGDVRKSTHLPATDLARLPSVLKEIFGNLSQLLAKKNQEVKYSIFRGDSFQLVLEPSSALSAALFIRAGLRATYPTTVSNAVDCRLAIGLGSIENMSDNITESTGEAFTQSGRLLEQIKKPSLMAITTSDADVTRELSTEFALCDELIRRWTHSQAVLVPGLLNGETQVSIADVAGISQAAVARKIQSMGWLAIEQLLNRYDELCKRMLSTG